MLHLNVTSVYICCFKSVTLFILKNCLKHGHVGFYFRTNITTVFFKEELQHMCIIHT